MIEVIIGALLMLAGICFGAALIKSEKPSHQRSADRND